MTFGLCRLEAWRRLPACSIVILEQHLERSACSCSRLSRANFGRALHMRLRHGTAGDASSVRLIVKVLLNQNVPNKLRKHYLIEWQL
jgi:hypothetical protein